ncbi:hypothetical protein CQW23_11843 [Capsicum baccatum]|uniref:AIPP2-like SPOC-like domain-containing protein n=1 Tax=Capsicum baccatum TaxID=33114 RepID=A0A2G2WQW5_CAPBA|nr:hypothetical protein CQW23_11843 [Capsicum baccatum]
MLHASEKICQSIVPPRKHNKFPSSHGINWEKEAYPPSKVKRKVYEFSRLLSGTLKFELVPREAIWTSQFNNHFWGKEDTGLYFLASERERSEIYNALVEFLHNKDSMMRMVINDVELLLITKSLIRMNTTRAI